MNIITHTFLHKQKLRLFIYDVNQEEGGHENLGNFANSWGYCLFFGGGGGGGVFFFGGGGGGGWRDPLFFHHMQSSFLQSNVAYLYPLKTQDF